MKIPKVYTPREVSNLKKKDLDGFAIIMILEKSVLLSRGSLQILCEYFPGLEMEVIFPCFYIRGISRQFSLEKYLDMISS